MKINKYLILIFFPFILSGCSKSVIIIPEDDGTRTIISNASKPEKAIKIARHKASRTCTLEGKSLRVIKFDTIYQGANKKQDKLIKSSKNMMSKRKAARPYMPTNYIYKGTLNFICVH